MSLSTRSEIRREVLRRLGGRVATLTAGTATTFTSRQLAYWHKGDDSAGKGWGVYIADLAEADRRRVVNSWDDSTGTGTIDSTSDNPASGDIAELTPPGDPGADEHHDALNRALQETERAVASVVPTYEGQRNFTFLNAPWIEHAKDVVGVYQRQSPNMLDNSSFELWGRGDDASLHAWDLSGSSATVTRVAGTYGRFAARVTRSGSDVTVSQTIPIPITHLYGKDIAVFGRIKSSTGSMASIRINDGTDTTSTSQHDGGGDWDEFPATHTVNADAVGPLTIELRLTDSDGTADFENVVACLDAVPDWLKDWGDQHARYEEIDHQVVQFGSYVRVITNQTQTPGKQILVFSTQPYFTLDEDDDVTDMPLQAAVAGTIVKLAEVHRKGENRERWDRLGALWQPRYDALRRSLAQAPRDNPTPQRVVLRGA